MSFSTAKLFHLLFLSKFTIMNISAILGLLCIALTGSNAVEITVNTTHAPDLAQFGQRVQSTLLEWFDQVGILLDSPTYVPPTHINVYFDPTYDGVAYASGNQIVGSVAYYQTHQDDIGSMIHEMAHVIQGYRSCYTSDDWWITEGIADWVRNYYFEPTPPQKPGPNNHYTDGYRVTAFFLNFVNNRYNPMIYWINKDCREGTYAHSIFPRLTGKTLDQLWDDMMREAADEYPSLGLNHFVKPNFDRNDVDKCMEVQK